MLEQREHQGRQEKLTSVTLPEALTVKEIKEVLKEYTDESAPDEKVTHYAKGNDQLDAKRKTEIPAIRIEIGEFEFPALRTEFFTTLISDLKGFSLKNVTSVKVERLRKMYVEEKLKAELRAEAQSSSAAFGKDRLAAYHRFNTLLHQNLR